MCQILTDMSLSSIRRVFLGRDIWVAFLIILTVYFLPPLLTESPLLIDSWAAPVWNLAIRTGRVTGCGSLLYIPSILTIFLIYTHGLAVVVGTLFREVANAFE